ncbi:hypothetical protein HK097_005404, partial [Rhizophlyctis rosea]
CLADFKEGLRQLEVINTREERRLEGEVKAVRVGCEGSLRYLARTAEWEGERWREQALKNGYTPGEDKDERERQLKDLRQSIESLQTLHSNHLTAHTQLQNQNKWERLEISNLKAGHHTLKTHHKTLQIELMEKAARSEHLENKSRVCERTERMFEGRIGRLKKKLLMGEEGDGRGDLRVLMPFFVVLGGIFWVGLGRQLRIC